MPIPRLLARRPLCVAAAALTMLGAACSGSDGDDADEPTTALSVASTTTIDPSTPTVDGVLRIGLLAPETGSQAATGPAMRAAAQLAVDEINAAGGVLGEPVELIVADAGDATTDVAGSSVDTLAAAKVDVIIGPPSSGVTSLVLDKLARSTAAVISPGNALADPPAGVPYLQLAPTLELLGAAVGAQLADGARPPVVIVARDDQFGQRVSAAAGDVLRDAGVNVSEQLYNPEAEVYANNVTAAIAAGPGEVVFIGYAETAEFLNGFILKGALPAALPMTVVSDRLDNVLFRRFTQPNVLSGLRAIGSGSGLDAERSGFAARVVAEAPDATAITFAAETYDAVIVAALAATRAGTDAPKKLHANADAVTGGTDGAECSTVAACLEAAADSAVTFSGQAGPYRLVGGQPTEARFAEVPFTSANQLDLANAVTFAATAG